MTIEFEDPSDYIDANDLYLKMIIYGKSGCGKTFLGSSSVLKGIHPGYKTLLILLETQGRVTIRATKKLGYWNENGRVVHISNMEQLKELIVHLRHEDHGYEVVVLDTVDEIQETIKGKRLTMKAGKEVLNMQDWQILKDQIRFTVTAFRDMPIHFLGLAHSLDIFTENEGRYTTIALNGKNQDNNIAGLVNLVGYLYKSSDQEGKVTRRVIFNGDSSYLTKELPEVKDREEPYFPLWIAKFRGEVDREDGIREWIKVLKDAKKLELAAKTPAKKNPVVKSVKKTTAKKTAPKKAASKK